MSYCECDISSPSSHHENCINEGCGKPIKTTIQKLREAREEINFLKSCNERLEEARVAHLEISEQLEKELELRTRWTNHHRHVSELDAQKKQEAERERDHYKNELEKANAEVQRQKDMVSSMMDLNHRNCELSIKNERELRDHIAYLAEELRKLGW